MDRQRSKPLLCKTVYCSNSVIIENRENLTTDFTVVLKSRLIRSFNDRGKDCMKTYKARHLLFLMILSACSSKTVPGAQA